jgi:hypothetical protein
MRVTGPSESISDSLVAGRCPTKVTPSSQDGRRRAKVPEIRGVVHGSLVVG